MQSIRSTRKVQFLGDSDEITQMAQFQFSVPCFVLAQKHASQAFLSKRQADNDVELIDHLYDFHAPATYLALTLTR